jgi:uncharacterized integral membrane protein
VTLNRLRWLITLPLAIVLVVFAVNNRGPVEVDLFPFGLFISWPLFVFVFLGLVLGLLIGLIFVWFYGYAARKAAHEHKARIRKLERSVKTLQSAADSSAPDLPTRPPALPE